MKTAAPGPLCCRPGCSLNHSEGQLEGCGMLTGRLSVQRVLSRDLSESREMKKSSAPWLYQAVSLPHVVRFVEPGIVHKSTENKNLPGTGHTTSTFGVWDFFVCCFVLFGRWGYDSVSVCSSSCSGTHSVAQSGLSLRDPPASSSQVLKLKVCMSPPPIIFSFKQLQIICFAFLRDVILAITCKSS